MGKESARGTWADVNPGQKDDLPGSLAPLDLIAEIRALSEQEDAIRRKREGLIAALIETACDVHHPQQVRAASRILECLFPSEFASIRHTIQHQAKSPEIDISKLSVEEKREFHRTLKRIVSGEDDTAAITVIDAATPEAEA